MAPGPGALAGARKPNGVVDGAILPTGSAVGDVLKVEVEQMLDGIEVQSVVKGREKTEDVNVLELLPSEKPFEAVIETRAKRDRSERRDGRGRRDGKRDGGRKDGGRGGDGKGRSDQRRQRPHFEAPPEIPQRPKPKRLRPGKARRNAVLADLPEEQRPIAEMALQGMSAVRARVKEENAKLEAAGQPTMPEASVVKMAEDMLPKLRVAEWLDRAEAAQRQMEHLDLRDLRSVVAASDDPIVARDESTRAVADDLRLALVRKQDEELTLWFGDIDAAIGVGRVHPCAATVVTTAQGRSDVPARPGATAGRGGDRSPPAGGSGRSVDRRPRGCGILARSHTRRAHGGTIGRHR